MGALEQPMHSRPCLGRGAKVESVQNCTDASNGVVAFEVPTSQRHRRHQSPKLSAASVGTRVMHAVSGGRCSGQLKT